MKKLLFVAIVVLLAFQANAKEVKIGIQAGVNHNALSTKLIETAGHQFGFGFYAGGQVEIFVDDRFSITPELQYAMVTTAQKDSYTLWGVPFHSTERISISQIELPIMLGFYPVEGFKVELGPRLSYVLGGTWSDNSQIGGVKESLSGNIPSAEINEMNRFNIGVGLGFGYRFDNGLGINARYNLDFINREKYDLPGGSKVGGVQLGLSCQF